MLYLLFESYLLVLVLQARKHDMMMQRTKVESAANVMIVCVLRIIILIVVHVDPVALIERANALLVLRINFN